MNMKNTIIKKASEVLVTVFGTATAISGILVAYHVFMGLFCLRDTFNLALMQSFVGFAISTVAFGLLIKDDGVEVE